MSLGDRVADAADLQTTGDDIDYPLWSGLNKFVHTVVAVGYCILPLIYKEVLDVTSLEKFTPLTGALCSWRWCVHGLHGTHTTGCYLA